MKAEMFSYHVFFSFFLVTFRDGVHQEIYAHLSCASSPWHVEHILSADALIACYSSNRYSSWNVKHVFFSRMCLYVWLALRRRVPLHSYPYCIIV